MQDKDEPFILGVDEAGRGPVLGHMVYSTCVCPAARREELARMNFDDSKVLKPEQRERMFEQIKQCEFLDYKLDSISPVAISAAMLKRTKISLNEVATNSTVGLIQAWLNEGFNVQEVYVDTIGIPEHYQARLARVFPQISKIVVAKKADSLYPIVSAASICAKVTRDQLLRDWRPPEEELLLQVEGAAGTPGQPQAAEEAEEVEGDEDELEEQARTRNQRKRAAPEPENSNSSNSSSKRLKLTGKPLVYSREFGSGYPGDPKTKAWLAGALDPVFGFPCLVRHSWKTASALVDVHCAPVDWGEDEEDAGKPGGKKKGGKEIKLNAVAPKFSASHQIPRSARAGHFRQHNLQLVVAFD